MEIITHNINGKRIVEVQAQRIDAACAIEFKQELLKRFDDGVNYLVLDLKHVKYIDSSGLGAIVGVFKVLSKTASFSIVGLTQAVERMFQLTRMDRVFNIHANVDEIQ